MRIGIVADIHDAVAPLQHALALLREHGAERIVTLGDAFETFLPGEPAVEVARLLEEVDAIGVWGNHDFGLSHHVADEVRREADPTLLRFAATLESEVLLADCRFCHIEPWKDPCSLPDLWQFDEIPNTRERAHKSFAAVPERVLFVGHFHSWFAVSPEGPLEWDGDGPIDLRPPERYLVSVGAVLHGSCTLYDTDAARLEPLR